MTWTDIHTHILPGLDDGASSDEEFLEMAGLAVEGGTSVTAATPHHDFENPSFEIRNAVAAVDIYSGLLRKKGITLQLVHGVEVRINAGLLRFAEEGGDLGEFCLGRKGRYVLVDLPLLDLPLATLDVIFQIQLRGIMPVLAHPERNRHLVNNPAATRGLIERGVEMQVDSGSLEGAFGKSARRAATSLLKEGAARLVASDAHDSRMRTPDLSGAAGTLDGLLGDGASRLYLEVNARLVIEGEEPSRLVDASEFGSLPKRLRLRR